jgi:hypothetical protein
MIGGGQGAFFGAVHSRAVAMTQRFEFIAGALSSDPVRALESANESHLSPGRIYSDYAAMAERSAVAWREGYRYGKAGQTALLATIDRAQRAGLNQALDAII